ncbi:MAG: hypothetical protein C4581_13235 [Nitrospiraceae bacterium]|nr:MAG: hypothetical protein C4581_13235 [Nitrospiraceae bacterium]
MGKNSHNLKSFIALILGIFFALMISETILQIIDFPKRPVSGWLNCKKMSPDQCNSLGFRGREIIYSPNDYVVLLVGDSEVYTAYFPYDQMPERLLERYLRKYRDDVKVFTLGDMGYGQDQQYLALKKYYEKHRADLVLLMFTARNDIDNNLFPTSGQNNTAKPTFWLDNGKLHGPTEDWMSPVGPKIKIMLLWQYYFGESIGKFRLEKWKKEVFPAPYQPLSEYEGEINYSWHEAWKKYPNLVFQGIEFERVVFANQMTPRSELRQYGINLTRSLFSEMKKLVEANNGHLIIFKEERPWEIKYTDKEEVFFMDGKYYRLSMKQYHNNLKDLFNGYEHHRIPLSISNYAVDSDNDHLSQQALDLLFNKLSNIISKTNCFNMKKRHTSENVKP